MNKETAWKKFIKTGSVRDYLNYKTSLKSESIVTIDNNHVTYSKEKYENTHEWVGHI